MDPDGSNQTRLTSNTATDGEPTWSPGGSKIAFQTDRDGNYEIYVMDADGSNQTRLTFNTASDGESSWSPDGTKIAFTSFRDGAWEIYVMDANGSNQTNLTNAPGSAETEPAWSRDGTKIAFYSTRDMNAEIYVMDADGTNQINLTNDADTDLFPWWSSDGSQIVFSSHRSGNDEIWVMNADGSSPTQLTSNSALDYEPRWGPPVGPKLTLSDHAQGQESDAFGESGSETPAELFGFKLDAGGQSITVTQLVFSLSNIVGLTDVDWSSVEIVVDDNPVDGNIGGVETTTVGGPGVVNQAAGTITFSTSFNVSAPTNYILRAVFGSLSLRDKVTIVLNPSNITASQTVIGSTTSVTHQEGCFYTESFQQWSSTTAGAWEVQDLSSAPFNVPANAVVEVAVRNSNANKEKFRGVRAVGSALERRFLLQEAEMGGASVVVMHVQTDSSSRIEQYGQATADVEFVLLGYWDCGTYVEAFQSFTAGAAASWQDRDLWTYGVGPGQVAEIVMTNSDMFTEWEAGVRKKGPSRQRVLDIQEAEAGGVDTATMFVQADATANATIGVYAEDNLSITFYLVGYWITAPRPYNELFTSIGSPAVDATWEAVGLGSFGVPANAVAEFALANMTLAAEHNMGVRENGSSLARLLDLQEAEAGGGDYGRMQVAADATSTIEFYHELLFDPHNFFLTGYWGPASAKPRIIRWTEVDPFRP